MSAVTDARRATRAANALHQLASAILHGGDVALWSANAAKLMTACSTSSEPWDRARLVALGAADLVALAERLDRYVAAVKG